MKHFCTFSFFPRRTSTFSSLLLFVVMLSFLCLTLSSASQAGKLTSDKSKERILRALSANEQLNDYNLRIQQSTKLNKIGANTFALKPEVQIKLNESMQTTSTVFFYDNMENGTNGWTTQILFEAFDDIWHQTTSNASSATHSWWAGVEGQGNYNTGNRINVGLVSPSIDLSFAVAPISLLFAESFATEQGWDFCMVEISIDDGSSWLPLRGIYGHAPNGNSNGWNISNISLDAFAGAFVKLRFHFDTGDQLFNGFPGWFVDDVIIYDQAGTISGKKFFDFNSNGQKDTDERGLRDWLITASGPVTLTTRTNTWGNYDLLLPLGSYTVSEVQQAGWTQTMPAGNYSVELTTADTTVTGLNFGNDKNGIFITGMKFDDINKNGVKDEGDTALANWRINLYNSNGTRIDFDRTDSLGMYTLFVFEPGQYIVEETEKYGWVASLPDSGRYRITVPNLNSNFTNLNFGNYYNNESNAIVGQKFHDVNMNGMKDEHEPGLAGWTIHLTAQGVGNKYRVTDDSGYYSFLSLPKIRTYRVREIHQAGWCQFVPDSVYELQAGAGEFYDSVDFGNYEVTTGSISGMKFFDRNGNAQKDSGEVGLSGFSLNLTGIANDATVNMTTTTDGDGNYSFTGLWSGTYTVSEVNRQGWVQTYPTNFGSYFVTLDCEENVTGYDFGNLDSLYLGSYRSFKAESLALSHDLKGKHLPVEAKPTHDDFCATFLNTETDTVTKLSIFWKTEIVLATIVSSKTATNDYINGKPNSLILTFTEPLQTGDSVTVCGKTRKPKLQGMNKWWWHFSNGKLSTKKKVAPITNTLRLPMPNAMNAIQVVGKGLRVGLGGAHSVVHSTFKDVIKSLIEIRAKTERQHIGAPSCLNRFTNGRLMKKEKKYLTPTEGQNRLFAKAVALKVNILSSQAGVTPSGFGSLMYDDGTGAANPFNNLTLYQIAAKIDSFMTQDTCDMLPSLGALTAGDLDDMLGLINASFSGPIDTLRFGGGVRFAPVRSLTDVPYLRYDTSTTARQEWIEMSSYEEVPEEFTVYQNYPNPFNPTTNFEFRIADFGLVTLQIYNLLGQQVSTVLEREALEAGDYEYEFNATNLPSGIYFYRINVESVDDDGVVQTYSNVKRMVLLK
ncbi:MAG: T9SS type A sorting domain-containing protein [Ignavibacteriae bacterium]|nr:T9SS type A sorting domain-containing protein [Ignavibacteriota bacterium]